MRSKHSILYVFTVSLFAGGSLLFSWWASQARTHVHTHKNHTFTALISTFNIPSFNAAAAVATAVVFSAVALLARRRKNRQKPQISRKQICPTGPLINTQTGELIISGLTVHPETQPELVILEDFSLELQAGETVAVVGQNGSGKSTLGRVLLGDPQYRVTNGEVTLDGKDVLSLSPDERANQLGMFVSWQTPVEIPGLTNFVLLHALVNAKRRAKGESELSVQEFYSFAKDRLREMQAEMLGSFLDKPVNEGLSGGERKRVELLHLCILRPERLVVLDEIDSGLDVEAVKFFIQVIKRLKQANKRLSVLLVTHSPELLKNMLVDRVVNLTPC